ncbi:MAG: hypothetical protein ACYCOO_00745, partial [Chitinophagaceae bacterium]
MRFTIAKIFAGIGICIFFFTSAKAQVNSPYSRYGLGDLSNSQNVINRGMGGVSQAYSDGQSINFINPASYSNLQLTTFDFGVESNLQRLSDPQNNSFHSGNGTLSYLQLGFPLKFAGGWGLNFGLVPLSRVNYNMTRTDSLPGISKVDYIYQGNGGLYQAFMGTGYSVGHLSFGFNLGYLFGSIQNATLAAYPDSLNIYNTKSIQTTSYGSFFWKGGLQYHATLSENLFLDLGVTGSASQQLNAKRNLLRTTWNYSSGQAANVDTALDQEGIPGK